MFDKLIALSPYIVALISVVGVIYTANRTNKNQLTEAYFSKMSAAYERFYDSVIKFIYRPDDDTRNEMITALYVAALYSSKKTSAGLQLVVNKAIERSQRGQLDAKELDLHVGELTALLQEELAEFDNRKR